MQLLSAVCTQAIASCIDKRDGIDGFERHMRGVNDLSMAAVLLPDRYEPRIITQRCVAHLVVDYDTHCCHLKGDLFASGRSSPIPHRCFESSQRPNNADSHREHPLGVNKTLKQGRPGLVVNTFH